MFDLEATCKKLGIWEEDIPESEPRSVAVTAVMAVLPSSSPQNKESNQTSVGKGSENRHNSHNSRTPSVQNNKTSLEGFRFLYGKPANEESTSNVVPFTEQKIADHKINKLKLLDDRKFIFKQLSGIHGKKRLEIVEQYFEERQKGMDAEPVEHKKENAGGYRANVWLRELSKVDKSRGLK